MAKRLTDTDKWKKPFLKSLPAEYKLFWIYLTDDINHAGIWEVDKDVAELRLGTKLSLDKALGLFREKVVVFDSGTKWFLPDFIRFQYGELKEGNKIHNSVISVLKKYQLLGHIKGYLTLKDKEKDKDKDIDYDVLIKAKKENFAKTLEPFLEDVGKEMLNDFYRYWSEATPDKRHLKWELEDTWEVKLRLVTWAKNDSKFKK